MRHMILLSCLILGYVSTAVGAIYVVRADGSGDFPTIQAAIDAVQDGDIIELADGTFAGNGNRDLDLFGKAITIVSQNGNADLCIIDCQGSEADPHRGFHFHSGESSTSSIEELTITNGWEHGGGGILIESASSPYFQGCTIRSNYANLGGGVYSRDGSSPQLVDCVLTANQGYWGAGMYCDEGSPNLVGCAVQNNAGRQNGAGVRFYYTPNISIIGTIFSSNLSATVGGAMDLTGCSGSIHNCSFLENAASLGGGACLFLSDMAVTGCTFDRNHANYGGAIGTYGSSPEVRHCTFKGNDAAMDGGGIWSDHAWPLVSNCTFYKNSAASHGGGLFADWDSHIQLENSIVAFCLDGEAVACTDAGIATLNCCDIYGNEDGDWVGCIADQHGVDGNIDEDPLLCDPENMNFMLQACSPCAPFAPPNPECDLIGAWPIGCGGTPIVPMTWGGIKARFRGRGRSGS